jgi:hypothetical protein
MNSTLEHDVHNTDNIRIYQISNITVIKGKKCNKIILNLVYLNRKQ